MNRGASKLEDQSVSPMTSSRSPDRNRSMDLVLIMSDFPKPNRATSVSAARSQIGDQAVQPTKDETGTPLFAQFIGSCGLSMSCTVHDVMLTDAGIRKSFSVGHKSGQVQEHKSRRSIEKLHQRGQDFNSRTGDQN